MATFDKLRRASLLGVVLVGVAGALAACDQNKDTADKVGEATQEGKTATGAAGTTATAPGAAGTTTENSGQSTTGGDTTGSGTPATTGAAGGSTSTTQ